MILDLNNSKSSFAQFYGFQKNEMKTLKMTPGYLLLIGLHVT